jgi:ABC-type transport system involved in multi-copper enzyme maturation permease subunit
VKLSRRRVRGIFRKEFREFRRNRSILVTMVILPLIFTVSPLIQILAVPASSASALLSGDPLAYMLGIPAIVPAVIAAYAVVGERQQGTLEPVLTTPIRREEFLLGKALAALLPSLVISYAVYAIFVVCVELFAHPGVAAAALQGSDLVAQVLFTPLLALLSIWVGIAISTRSNEPRVAQQLGLLACLPSVAVTTLIAYDVIHATFGIAIVFGVVLLVLDRLGWRIVSAMFDRERLITGTRS